MKAAAAIQHDHPWNLYLSNALNRTGIHKNVIIKYSSDVLSPCITGYLKAMILVPVSLCSRLSPEQAEAVLIHELAHLKHFDYYWNIATRVVNALLFFNPFVWMIARQCERYREYACDEMVKKYDGEIALSESLLEIAKFRNNGITAALALHNNNKKQLFNRVQNLLTMKKPNRISVPSWALTLTFSFLLIFAVPSSSESQKAENFSEELDKAILQAYRNGNSNFILLQAIKDHVISLHGSYDLWYYNGKVYIDRKPLAEPLQTTYVTTIRKFFTDHNANPDGKESFSMRGGPLKMKDILDSTSDLRRIPVPDNRIIPTDGKSPTKLIVEEMVREGIADTSKALTISYNVKGVFVNKKKLTGEQAEKYKKLFQEASGIVPRQETDGISIQMMPSAKN